MHSEVSALGDFGINMTRGYVNLDSIRVNRSTDKNGVEILRVVVTVGVYLEREARDAGARPLDKFDLKEIMEMGDLANICGAAYDRIKNHLNENTLVNALEDIP